MRTAPLHTIGALATALLSAVAANHLSLPMPLIFGSLAGAALYANIVGSLTGGDVLRRGGMLVVGASVGSLLTADVLATLGDNLPLMLMAGIAANLVGLAMVVPLAVALGITRLTAAMACLPAGMAEMASLARELGGDDQIVSIVHSLRVVIVVVTLPLVAGFAALPSRPIDLGIATEASYVPFLAASFVAALLSRRAGILNPWIVMPMVLGTIHAALVGPVAPTPGLVLAVAQISIGASLGARLDLRRLARLPRVALAGSSAAVLMILFMAFAVAPLLSSLSGIDARTMVLAVSPGGLGEMVASAKALGLTAAVVAGYQFVRSILTNVVAPPLLRRFAARARGGMDFRP